jgi:predicted RNase H-like HicB family nuclease
MHQATTMKDYGVHVYWDDRAGYFVAEIPEIYSCAADGPSQAKAVSNLEETFAVLKEAYTEEKLNFPRPNPELPISVRDLSALSDVVKVSRLAKLAGLPGQTIASKLKRGTEFSGDESRKIARALDEHGLVLHRANLGRNRATQRSCGDTLLEGAYLAVEEPSASGGTGARRMKQPGLDGRHHDVSGQIAKKHGNTTLASLRKEFGSHLAPGRRADVTLKTLCDEAGGKSLNEVLWRKTGGQARQGSAPVKRPGKTP